MHGEMYTDTEAASDSSAPPVESKKRLVGNSKSKLKRLLRAYRKLVHSLK
jgi:hypothetical protein